MTFYSRASTAFLFLVLSILPSSILPAFQNDSSDFPPTVRTEVNVQRFISGDVFDEDSNPIPDVDVYTTDGSSYRILAESRQRFPSCAQSNGDGQFGIEVTSESRLLFVAPGFAPSCVPVPMGSRHDARLTEGRTISGTILRPDGDPFEGASVTMVGWAVPFPPADPTKPDFRVRGMPNYQLASLPEFGADIAVETNESGHFEIEHLPETRQVWVSIKAKGFTEQVVSVLPSIEPEDQFQPEIKHIDAVENEFELSMEVGNMLKVGAVTEDSGSESEIARIHIEQTHPSGSASRFTHEVHAAQAEVALMAEANGLSAMVEPVETETLLGSRIELPPATGEAPIEREIKFETGRTVSGIVVSMETDEPIAGVQLRWRTPNMKEYAPNGNFPAMEIVTDAEGKFEFAAPDADAILGIVGDVPGYCSVFSWHESEKYDEADPALMEEFTRTLTQGELDDMEPFEFRLRPDYHVIAQVVLPDGSPASNCIVTSEKSNSTILGRSWNIEKLTKETDVDGFVEFENWYADAFKLAEARQPADENSWAGSARLRGSYPNKLQAFSETGFYQGAALVPLPEIEAATNEIEVTIEMQFPGNVQGRIVNLDGDPITGLKVEANTAGTFGLGAGQRWTTTTRDDGGFLMQDLPVNVELTWSLDYLRVKTEESGGKIEINTSKLSSNSTLKIPAVRVVDLSELARPLAELFLEDLDNEDALRALAEYITENMERIPVGKSTHFMHGSSISAEGRFKEKLVLKSLELMKQLADREPGSAFELSVLKTIPFLIKKKGESMPDYSNQILVSECVSRLMANHLENPDSQEGLIKVLSINERIALMGRGDSHWKKVYEQSPFEETRAIACVMIATQCHATLGSACSRGQEQERFDRLFTMYKKHVTEAMTTFADVLDEAQTETLKSGMQHVLLNLSFKMNRIEGMPERRARSFDQQIVAERADELVEFLSQYVEMPGAREFFNK